MPSVKDLIGVAGPFILILVVSELIIGVVKKPEISQPIDIAHQQIFHEVDKFIGTRQTVKQIQIHSDHKNKQNGGNTKTENDVIKILLDKILNLPEDITELPCKDEAATLDKGIEIAVFKIPDIFTKQIKEGQQISDQQALLPRIDKWEIYYLDDTSRRFFKSIISSKTQSLYPSVNIKIITEKDGRKHEQVHHGCNDKALAWILQTILQGQTAPSHIKCAINTIKTNKTSCMLLEDVGLITVIPTSSGGQVRPVATYLNPNDKSQVTSALINQIIRNPQEKDNSTIQSIHLGNVYVVVDDNYKVNRLHAVVDHSIEQDQLTELLSIMSDKQLELLADHQTVVVQTKSGLLSITSSESTDQDVAASVVAICKSTNSRGLKKLSSITVYPTTNYLDLKSRTILDTFNMSNFDTIKIINNYHKKTITYITPKSQDQYQTILDKLTMLRNYHTIMRILNLQQ